MPKNKTAQRKAGQLLRKMLREAHLSPEMRLQFKAINIFVEDWRRSEAKKKKACKLTFDNRKKLIKLSESQNHRCCYCGDPTWHPEIICGKTHRSEASRATIEHLLPRCEGGTFKWENIAMACSECNTARGHTPLEEFLAAIHTPAKPKEARQKEISLAQERKLKKERGDRNRFRLFIIAAWILPENYNHVMENLDKGDVRNVLGTRPPHSPKAGLMKRIRRRVVVNRMAA